MCGCGCWCGCGLRGEGREDIFCEKVSLLLVDKVICYILLTAVIVVKLGSPFLSHLFLPLHREELFKLLRSLPGDPAGIRIENFHNERWYAAFDLSCAVLPEVQVKILEVNGPLDTAVSPCPLNAMQRPPKLAISTC